MAGHPLETIKVRIQMSSNQVTVKSCIRNLIVNEGALSLWKGLSQPMMGAIPITSMVFVT